mgnify:CR=1 FL=1
MRRVVLELNTLGDRKSRRLPRGARLLLFNEVSELSEDSRRRLDRNPLRIFDSKEETDQRVAREAPLLPITSIRSPRNFFDHGSAAGSIGSE